ncbi:hypothetical protein ETH_00012005, partial [Eimeria tenella]
MQLPADPPQQQQQQQREQGGDEGEAQLPQQQQGEDGETTEQQQQQHEADGGATQQQQQQQVRALCSSCSASAAAQQLPRERVESSMQFLGLVLLSNELRADAKETISLLKGGKVRPVIITGDSIFTAAAVALRCGMLSPAPHDSAAAAAAAAGSAAAAAAAAAAADDVSPASCEAPGSWLEGELGGGPRGPPLLLLGQRAPEGQQQEVVWKELLSGREVPQAEVLGCPERWPELAVTEETFDILRSQPLLSLQQQQQQQQQVSKEEQQEQQEEAETEAEGAPLVPRKSCCKELQQQNFKGAAAAAAANAGDSVLDALLMRIRIFARTTPKGKSRVVHSLMTTGHFVLMCGDGANDSAALRTAHVGLALSRSAASIAAPFTSTSMRPSAVISLLKEGRCSLATSLAAYKFMVLYGLLLSLAKVVLLVAAGGACMSQALYLTVDVGVLLGISNLMVLARPKAYLRVRSPTSSLLGPTTITSLCLMLAIDAFFLVTLYARLLQM